MAKKAIETLLFTHPFPLVISDDSISSFSVEFFAGVIHFENVWPIFAIANREIVFYGSYATKIKNKSNQNLI